MLATCCRLCSSHWETVTPPMQPWEHVNPPRGRDGRSHSDPPWSPARTHPLCFLCSDALGSRPCSSFHPNHFVALSTQAEWGLILNKMEQETTRQLEGVEPRLGVPSPGTSFPHHHGVAIGDDTNF